jgi:iron complex outermembrane receptor protein
MRKDGKKGLWWTAAAAALVTGLAGMSSPALAQTDANEDDEQQAQQAQEENDGIVVTGSRIRRSEFTSTSPVQIITSETSTLEGLVDTSAILQGSSVAAGSQQINNQYTGFVVEGGSGVNTLSLRGLGPTRTLVLLNGRRLNPAGTRGQVGAVDLNVIPSSAVERYEILKDGASSIYGSDAIAGVVNIITRQNLDGGVVGGSLAQTFDGGGEQYQLEASWGQTFDRGNYLISAEYTQIEELTFGDRDYLSCPQDLVRQAPAPAFGNQGGRILDLIDPATGQSKCFERLEGVVDRLQGPGGRFIPNASATAGSGFGGLNLNGWQRVNLSFNQVSSVLYPGRAVSTLNATELAAVEAQWRQQQVNTPQFDPRTSSRSAISPATRMTLMAQGSYDLTPSIEIYGEALFNRRESEQHSWRQLFPNVSGANPNNPFTGLISRSIALVPTDGEQSVDTYRAVVGFRGDLPILNGWTYDVYAQYGWAEGDYTNDIIYNDRVLATTGAAACTTTGITNISNFSCASVPTGVQYFLPSFVSDGILPANQAEFLFGNETGTTFYRQNLLSGLVTGDLFDLPAGAVAAAVGFEYRQETIKDVPGLNARNGNLWGQTSAGITRGTDAVREVFGELEVPLLAGLPGIDLLTLNGSYRWTDYDSYGENDTYKVGINWQITPEYRLRATQGTSYRAPALYELFLANQTAFANQGNIDPCIFWEDDSNPNIRANCAAVGVPVGYTGVGSSALVTTGGGLGILDAETSDALTLGFVWTPSWTDLNVAIDYFEIEVNDQVAQFGAANILAACYSDPGFPNSPFCTLFQRDLDPASTRFLQILTVNNSYVNLNSQRTRGVDLTLRYEHEFSIGTFTLTSQSTFTFEDEIEFFDGTAEDFNGELFESDAAGNIELRFDRGDWTVFWATDWVSKASNTEDFGGDIFGWRGTPYQAYYKQYAEFTALHDASVRYQSDDWTVVAGIRNIFNEEPPAVSTGTTSRIGNAPAFLINGDLLLGRTGFVSLTRRF